MPKRPPALGTVNGFIPTRARFGRKRFVYNGTTVGLANAAYAAGARVGDRVVADVLGPFTYVLKAAPAADTRVPGVWPERVSA